MQLYTTNDIFKLKPKQRIRLLLFYMQLQHKYCIEASIVQGYISTGKRGASFTLFTYSWHEMIQDSEILLYAITCLQIGWLLKGSDPGRKIYEALLEEQKEVMRLLTGAGS